METGSASSSGTLGSKSFGGLKFGQKIYFEGAGGSGVQKKPDGGSASAPPPPSPAKKGRTGVVQGGQPPRCQVEGCDIDLSDAKTYYSRHKVCGAHSKSPTVIVAGLQQRFCQQCSRFHQLPEFDKGKRSCRRRLAGHNERRRKPQGSLLSSRYGSFSSSLYDNHSKSVSFTMDFSAYPSHTAEQRSWPNAPPEQFNNHANITGKFQPPWQSNSPNYLPNLLHGSTTRPNYASHGGSSEDSSSALSLLSNQHPDSSNQSLSLGVNSFLNTNINAPMVQPSMSHGAAISQYACPAWSFKGNQTGNNLHELPPHLGPRQISQPLSSEYATELGLAQQDGVQFHHLELLRGYDSSPQDMHWSL